MAEVRESRASLDDEHVSHAHSQRVACDTAHPRRVASSFASSQRDYRSGGTSRGVDGTDRCKCPGKCRILLQKRQIGTYGSPASQTTYSVEQEGGYFGPRNARFRAFSLSLL